MNHVQAHSETIKHIQHIIESLEKLNEIMKKFRKLKGSDLTIELVKNDEYFEEFYKVWDALLDKQLKLGLNKINLDPDDKIQQLKEIL